MKNLLNNLKDLGVQSFIISLFGCMFLLVDHGGFHYSEDYTYISYIGGVTCIIGIFWYYIGTMIYRLFK